MALDELITRRFGELDAKMHQLHGALGSLVVPAPWQEWATSVLNLLENSFGTNNVHARNFRAVYESSSNRGIDQEKAKGVFRAAKADYEGGYIFSAKKTLSGEILGDFVALSKAAMQEGNKDVAAVLASAALEDALKRYARESSLDVEHKVMSEVVSALKSKGLVSGAQKFSLDTMPRLRDYAMHADWDKLTTADVGSIVGFVDQFLLSHFS